MTSDQSATGPGTDILAALDRAGVPQTLKGKVQKAIFRLIAGGMGLEYFQQVRENLDTIEGRSRINALVADEVGRQAIADPVFMERAKARFLGEMATKQQNVEAIAVAAQAKSEADPEADNPSSDGETEPSQDWMNSFTRAAEDASSDELRTRLASVLAGEAKKPGTFSRATVRFIAEAEKSDLEEFQLALQYRVGNAIFRDEGEWGKGVWFARSVSLESVGLVTGSGGFTSRTVKFDSNGNGFVFGRELALIATGRPDLEKQLSILLLTRTGQEVAELLDQGTEPDALKRIAERMDKSELEQIRMGPIVRMPDGQMTVLPATILWKKAEEETATG